MLSNPLKSSFWPKQWFLCRSFKVNISSVFVSFFFFRSSCRIVVYFPFSPSLSSNPFIWLCLLLVNLSMFSENFSADSLIEFLIRSRRRELWLSSFNESSSFLLPHISSKSNEAIMYDFLCSTGSLFAEHDATNRPPLKSPFNLSAVSLLDHQFWWAHHGS